MATGITLDLNGSQPGTDLILNVTLGTSTLAPNAIVEGSGDFGGQTLTITTNLLPNLSQALLGGIAFDPSGTSFQLVGNQIQDSGGHVLGTITPAGLLTPFTITFTSQAHASEVQTIVQHLVLNGGALGSILQGSTILTYDLGGVAAHETVGLNVLPCFLRGTRVLARQGECPVEELEAGDEVFTLNGGWQPLRWVGRSRTAGPQVGAAAPVRIRAGAFGPGLPARDVCISPDHGVFFRDRLIPVKRLVNGTTVFHDQEIDTVQYFHLLLDRHAVIFSEGLATESYCPHENLGGFENLGDCPEPLLEAIRAGDAECLRDAYPRIDAGPAVETARALLARRAPAEAILRAAG
ncbi:Hint domain-containing protein [Candidatus Methylocalor cossyra]|uniref:Hint domain-containing protein n=1 Tax=Candidatus Methylocalor cossyra TaxID=3108543 RepID=A0ABM9NIV5_9GAMM